MDKKYTLLSYHTEYIGRHLFRIVALKSFGDVTQGEYGGFVSNESNLSHSGTCWIYDDAIVCDDAVVEEYARITDNAIIQDYGKVHGRAIISDNSIVRGYGRVRGNVVMKDNAIIQDSVRIQGGVEISGNTNLEHTLLIGGQGHIHFP